jgi:hypothetical protein
MECIYNIYERPHACMSFSVSSSIWMYRLALLSFLLVEKVKTSLGLGDLCVQRQGKLINRNHDQKDSVAVVVVGLRQQRTTTFVRPKNYIFFPFGSSAIS